MSDTVKAHLTILWEHEIRLAAALLRKLHDTPRGETDEEQDAWAVLASDALNAAVGALWGAEDESCPLILSRGEHLIQARRKGSLDDAR